MSAHGFPHHPTYGYPAAHQHSVFLHAPVPPPGMPQHPLANMKRMAHNIGGQGAPQQLYPDAVLNPTQHPGFVPNIPTHHRAPHPFGYPGAQMLPNPLHLPHGPGASAQGPSQQDAANLHQQLLEKIRQLEAQIEKEKEKTMKLNTKWLDQQQRQMRDEEYWNYRIQLKQSEVQGWQPSKTDSDDPTTAIEPDPMPTPQDIAKVPFNMIEFKAKMMKSVSKVIKTEVADDGCYGVDPTRGSEDQELRNSTSGPFKLSHALVSYVPSLSELSRSSEKPVATVEPSRPTEPEGSEKSKLESSRSLGEQIKMNSVEPSRLTEPEKSEKADLDFSRSLEDKLNYDFDADFSTIPSRPSPSLLDHPIPLAVDADFTQSSAPIGFPSFLSDHPELSPDAADSDDSLPPSLLSPDAEVSHPSPSVRRLPGRRPAYRLLRDAAKIWKPHAQDLPKNLKAFKEYFATRQIYKKTMKIAPILDPGSLEYAKRVQEANAHRRETLVRGDPACAFVSCLYDASKGPIPQLVTKPPQVWILYASFRRDTADQTRVPTKKEIGEFWVKIFFDDWFKFSAADWNRISEQQGNEFWEWKLRTTKLYDEHLMQLEKGYIWVQPDVQPRGRKRKVLNGEERGASKKTKVQREQRESEDSKDDDDDDFMT
ncbi:Protein CBG07805 [Caenorhabditis briggsae]|uniref:Protein CBG07805 n=1 Tax=Caenorhabditis briggsae TaxID=6238 RepID=A8X575_CAEBR|nr:Protein CBG07805 [Caenorhabditis briggsae]CAP27774.2 Protein CBG07805 [Caenorhabditis briggsae]